MVRENKKIALRTIRLSKKLDELLQKDANSKRITVGTLISTILTKNLSQNYLSTDDHKTGELYQSKVVLCLLFIPCEQFSEPVVP